MEKYTDEELKSLWRELRDIPFDEDEEDELILGHDWLHFRKGTPREDIWHWFDAMHSKGLYVIMGLGKGE